MTPRTAKRTMRAPDPNVLVIFGASGDLTSRKLIPALFELLCAKLLPERFAIVGFARTQLTDDEFRDQMRAALEAHIERIDEDAWKVFRDMLHYIAAGEHDEAAFRRLAQELEQLDAEHRCGGNRLYYLATPPPAYLDILDLIGAAGLSKAGKGWRRIVVEKPFGRDLDSARELDARLHACFEESQIFRIDHYLEIGRASCRERV